MFLSAVSGQGKAVDRKTDLSQMLLVCVCACALGWRMEGRRNALYIWINPAHRVLYRLQVRPGRHSLLRSYHCPSCPPHTVCRDIIAYM